MTELPALVLDGTSLTPTLLRSAARHTTPVVLGPQVTDRLTTNAVEAAHITAEHNAYGRTTGVGANRHVAADDSDGQHGRRLLRSHAAGAGPLLPHETARALMIIRANQLANARSGIAPDVPQALVRALNDGRSSLVRAHGGLGTGDITVLAELGLSLLGERPWSDGTVQAYLDDIDASGALPLMSSSAPTLAVAALAAADLSDLLDSVAAICALSSLAVRANPEAWSPVGASSRPHPGMIAVGETMRRLTDGVTYRPTRLQDPFAWRCLVSVHGAVADSIGAALHQIRVDINASAENPLYADGDSWHHGGFHHLGLALSLDQVRLALVQLAGLSLARLTKLNDPDFSSSRPFLADGPAGSSGTMVLEYTAASAVAELRQSAAPATSGHTVISMGLEDHASFAWQSATASRSSLEPLRTVLACELVAAVRALRLQQPALHIPVTSPAAALLAQCSDLPAPGWDQPPADALTRAVPALERLAAAVAGTG